MKLYKDNITEHLGEGLKVKGLSADIIAKARRKIEMVKASVCIDDLRVPPSNRLEKLKGDRAGQWSIRVNDKFRICFDWIENRAFNIEFVDYH